MLCYKDKTFCSSRVKKHTCGREIKQEEIKHAEKLGLGIAYSNYCDDLSIN